MIRLRGTQGEALTAEQECYQLETHFASVFQAEHAPVMPPMQPLEKMPFTQDDLCSALREAPIHKAVAPGTMPNLLLRTPCCGHDCLDMAHP